MSKKMGMDRFAEFSAAVVQSLPRDMETDVVQEWIRNRAALAKVLRGALVLNDVASVYDWHSEWMRFYQEVFGLVMDLSGVAIPDEKPGFNWVVMIAQGLTLNQVWAKCKEKFPSYSYLGDDIDEAVPVNDRTAEQQAYAKRFRDRVEADEELKDLSANQLKKRHIQSITLLERLLLELWYFWKTGKHLDIQNITLCAGSRYSDGRVPNVDWDGGRLDVSYYSPDFRRDCLRARAAV